MEASSNAIVFGLGDYLDFARTTQRSFLKGYTNGDTFFDSLDKMVDDSIVLPFVKLVNKHCPSFAKKCVTLVEGNHRYNYGGRGREGLTSTQEICRLLGIPYGGLSSIVRLTVLNSKGHFKMGGGRNLSILSNHGTSGSSGSVSAAIGKLERSVIRGWRDMDIIFSAHDHTRGHADIVQMGISQRGEPRLIEYHTLVVKTGCFQKGYLKGAVSESFVEKNLFNPTARGWFSCTVKTKRTNGDRENEKWIFTDFN